MEPLKTRLGIDAEPALVSSVIVSEAIWPEAVNHAELEATLKSWGKRNARLGLTGAIMMSEDHIVHILEGPLAAVQKMRRNVAHNPHHRNVRVVAERAVPKRSFGGWPLAYVGPSRWVQKSLANRPLPEMAADSADDADFLVELVLFFVGEGPFHK